MTTYVRQGEPTAARRRIYWRLITTLGAEKTGAAGTPSIMVDGAALTTSGIGAAVEVSNGFYYAELDDADTDGLYVGYWAPAGTAADTMQSLNSIQIGGPVTDGMARLGNEVEVSHTVPSTTKVFDAAGVAGGVPVMTLTVGDGGTNKTKVTRT